MVLKMIIIIYYLSNTEFIEKLTVGNAYPLLSHSAINLTVNVKFDINGGYKYCLPFFSCQYFFLRI